MQWAWHRGARPHREAADQIKADLEAKLAEKDAELARLIDQWRELAFINHTCVAKYGDDGEMQCNHCRIDFKRDAPQDIRRKLYVNGVNRCNFERDLLAERAAEIQRLREALEELLGCFPEECHCHEAYRVRENNLGYRFKDPDCDYCGNEDEIKKARSALHPEP